MYPVPAGPVSRRSTTLINRCARSRTAQRTPEGAVYVSFSWEIRAGPSTADKILTDALLCFGSVDRCPLLHDTMIAAVRRESDYLTIHGRLLGVSTTHTGQFYYVLFLHSKNPKIRRVLPPDIPSGCVGPIVDG